MQMLDMGDLHAQNWFCFSLNIFMLSFVAIGFTGLLTRERKSEPDQHSFNLWPWPYHWTTNLGTVDILCCVSYRMCYVMVRSIPELHYLPDVTNKHTALTLPDVPSEQSCPYLRPTDQTIYPWDSGWLDISEVKMKYKRLMVLFCKV